MNNIVQQPWPRTEFEAQLRGMEKYYHIHHPYHTLMNEGKLTKHVRLQASDTPRYG